MNVPFFVRCQKCKGKGSVYITRKGKTIVETCKECKGAGRNTK